MGDDLEEEEERVEINGATGAVISPLRDGREGIALTANCQIF